MTNESECVLHATNMLASATRTYDVFVLSEQKGFLVFSTDNTSMTTSIP